MNLSLNKLMGKYGKRIVLIFSIHCIKPEESQSHHFLIHSSDKFVLKKYCLDISGFLQSGALFVPCICKYTL